jgi:hypothetical protein
LLSAELVPNALQADTDAAKAAADGKKADADKAAADAAEAKKTFEAALASRRVDLIKACTTSSSRYRHNDVTA